METSTKLQEAIALNLDLKKNISSILKAQELENLKQKEMKISLEQECASTSDRLLSVTNTLESLQETLRTKQAEFIDILSNKEQHIAQVRAFTHNYK